MKKKRMIVNKQDLQHFPLPSCNLDPYWNDLLIEKTDKNEKRTSNHK